MKYKLQDDMKDHTPIYKQGINKELWPKNTVTKVNSKSNLVDYSRGGSSELRRKHDT